MKKQNDLPEHGEHTYVYWVEKKDPTEKVTQAGPESQKVQSSQQLREGQSSEGPGVGDLDV